MPNTDQILQAVNRNRLVDTARKLIEVPSPTGQGGAVADRLADMLSADGFAVERPEAGHPQAPAVVVHWQTDKPGRTLQFNAHLDTVHLPFVPPAVHGDRLTGSESCDMKGGFAAAVEALRVLRETNALPRGGILLTAHDLHESPWGDNHQLHQMIEDKIVGDAVLLPEYLSDRLAVIGRGGFTWNAVIRRKSPPIHEVLRPKDEASVIAVGAELVRLMHALDQKLAGHADELAGPETVFIGQFHCGEIYNQFPQECRVEGTRRWLPNNSRQRVEMQLHELIQGLASETGTTITTDVNMMRDSFLLNRDDPIVDAFQQAHQTVAGDKLPIGAKPFCDDGNTFWSIAGVPAITHGPLSAGAHTLDEWVSIDDLVRLAKVYALTAIQFVSRD